MSWVGGKKALRDEILPRFPLDYKRYIEVFGGGGWVLFHKNPGKDFEIYNDFNGDLVIEKEQKQLNLIDRKLRRKIAEKKQLHGQRMG